PLIIASGASARWLGLENEEKFIGHGLTSCATCDGAFYRNVPVAVVGGGDSAAEEALFLTRFASKVYLIHRRDKLRASKIMADRVLVCEKIEPIWNTVVTRYVPDGKGEMSAVMLRNVQTHEERELPVACVFVAIGHDPNTKAFEGKLETDPDGYLLVRHLAESKHPGVFIAGDVADYIRERTSDEHVLIVPGEKTERTGDERARIYSIRSPLISKTARYRALLDLRTLGEILGRERPDIIESSDPYQVGWKAIAFGKT